MSIDTTALWSCDSLVTGLVALSSFVDSSVAESFLVKEVSSMQPKPDSMPGTWTSGPHTYGELITKGEINSYFMWN